MKFFLDYNVWRCGTKLDCLHSLGEGSTYLLNEEGFMCCLGQWNSQCGIENNLLINQSNPSKLYSLGVKPNLLFLDKEGFHTKFSNEALIINDWSTTTVQEKALALKELCEDNGCELEFVNFPEGFFDVVSN